MKANKGKRLTTTSGTIYIHLHVYVQRGRMHIRHPTVTFKPHVRGKRKAA